MIEVGALLSSFEDKHKQKVKKAYERLQALRKKYPVGSTKEVIAWKNEGQKCYCCLLEINNVDL